MKKLNGSYSEVKLKLDGRILKLKESKKLKNKHKAFLTSKI